MENKIPAVVKKYDSPGRGQVVGTYTATGAWQHTEGNNGPRHEMICKCGDAQWILTRDIFGPKSEARMNGCKNCNPLKKNASGASGKIGFRKDIFRDAPKLEALGMMAKFLYGHELSAVKLAAKSINAKAKSGKRTYKNDCD